MEATKKVRVKKEPISTSQSISETSQVTMRSNKEQTIEISNRKRSREDISNDDEDESNKPKRQPILSKEIEVKAEKEEEKFSATEEFAKKTSIQTVSVAFLNDEPTTNDNNQSNKPNKSKVPSDKKGCFKCQTCQKRYTNSKELKKHRRIHSGGEKHFVCGICHKRFVELYSLENHRLSHTQRLHTGERPYVCDICNKSFVEFYSLESHRTSHKECHRSSYTGEEKPFECGICKKGFFRLKQLRKHHGKIHKRQQKL